jgi:transposase
MRLQIGRLDHDPLRFRAFCRERGEDAAASRRVLVDALGLLSGVSVSPANIQDRDGARGLLQSARSRFPFIEKIFPTPGYKGAKKARTAAAGGCWQIQIVKRSDTQRLIVLRKQWIVERTLAWIIAMIQIKLNCLAAL